MRRLRLNRTQGLVLGFFVLAWIGLVAILVAAPEIYHQALRLPASEWRLSELAFLVAISAFIALLGVVRRWRWTFWLIVVAFILGVLRVPASILQLTGLLRAEGPAWYALVTGSHWSGPVCHRAGDASRLSAKRHLGELLTRSIVGTWILMNENRVP